MTIFPFDIVGFDLDGTLLDTSGELTDAVNYTLQKAGCQTLSQEEVKPMIGLGARHMLIVGLQTAGFSDAAEAEAKTREFLPVLLDYYGDNLGRSSPPFPGLLDAMAKLDAMDVTMAVVTNKFERFAIKLLTEIGLIDRFACVIGGDTMGRGKAKPHRAPIDEMIRRCGGIPGNARAAFIGDSIYDTGAAHAAGLPAIAVSFGFLHQPIEELGADAIIDHYDQLIPTLKKLGN